MRCDACGTENPATHRFCGGCGAALARACPSCGEPVPGTFAFCGGCGSPLSSDSAPSTATAVPRSAATPVAERRLVTVLFADLVGFTTLSESRDAEDVRGLLSDYFAACRTVIERYGGTIEKFIGDAVMAVWGTPVANEDDPERAVRAALDVIDTVAALGRANGIEQLAARAGVLTGEAAVTLSAVGQGMVAGDLVNSAARIQSAAQPGTVLVGEATRRATESAVAYADAGTFELKGKAEPVLLWQATRVLAGRGGAQKSAGLEAPFVGREREFRLVKDLFHSVADNGVAHLLSVSGAAGIGKSRLSWEFFKYVDGLSDTVWWQRGRCLAYGEGVTFWALAEMVRTRAGIEEAEPAVTALPKLQEMVRSILTDDEERRWVEPRLASLLSLGDHDVADASDLFSGWRLFFERMSERYPVVLLFEDIQWADAALLDFIDYLLDWSRQHQLFVITLARPELMDRRSTWASGRRNVTALSLEPLPDSAMDELLRGLVPGLPDHVLERIRQRAEGMPLYAVETVRMLLDQGSLVREADRYVPVGDIDELQVPQTLHGLIAARLDALAASERALLQDASVLGKTFTLGALAAVSGRDEGELSAHLAALVRKELLGVQADPRSPQRGHYGFLQALVQKVAYDTLARRDRKARHLAVAEYLASEWAADDSEIVELVAAHYVDAYRLEPDAADGAAIKAQASAWLTRAGDRARSLAANRDAARYYVQASELTDDAAERGTLLYRAAEASRIGALTAEARPLYEAALDLLREVGDERALAEATADFGRFLWWEGNDLDAAIQLIGPAYDVISAAGDDDATAQVGAGYAQILFFMGRVDESLKTLEVVLPLAEGLGDPALLSECLNTKSLCFMSRLRRQEAAALLQHAVTLAEAGGSVKTLMRAYSNLAYFADTNTQHEQGVHYASAVLALARKVGDRPMEKHALTLLAGQSIELSRWDESQSFVAELLALNSAAKADGSRYYGATWGIILRLKRGDLAGIEELAPILSDSDDHDSDLQVRASTLTASAAIAFAHGDYAAATSLTRRVFDECAPNTGLDHGMVRTAIELLMDSALTGGDLQTAGEVLSRMESLPPAHLVPGFAGELRRCRARLDAAHGEHDQVEAAFRDAERIFADNKLPYRVALTRLELAEWLHGQGRDAELPPLLDAAGATLRQLRAEPGVRRVEALQHALAAA